MNGRRHELQEPDVTRPLTWLQQCAVTIQGKTDLHNYYPESWQRRDSRKAGRANGSFTMGRTKGMLYAVAAAHRELGKRYGRVFLVTLTSDPSWDQFKRREGLRAFLDLLRKERGYLGHLWVTERHKGNGMNSATIHHHIAVRFGTGWHYRSRVVEWSKRYCGSSNGLDIKAGKGNRSWGYISKCVGYLTKNLEPADSLPFRWWGTSKVLRKWRQPMCELHLLTTISYNVRRMVRCAYISRAHALSEVVQRVAPKEAERMHKTIRRRRRKRCLTDSG